MRRFTQVKGAGPWKFEPQKDKFAYINNPRWTPEMAHQDDHKPCGYWYKEWSPTVPYIAPGALPIWRPSYMSFDPDTRTLYTACVYDYVGNKRLLKVFASDIDLMRHKRAWDVDGSVRGPAYQAPYFEIGNGHVWPRVDKGDKYLIPVGQSNRVALLNARDNVITQYNLKAGALNTTYDDSHHTLFLGIMGGVGLAKAVVNYEQQRLYCLFVNTYHHRRNFSIGYIDLTVNAAPYPWTEIIYETYIGPGQDYGFGIWDLSGARFGYTDLIISPENDLIIYCGLTEVNHAGCVGVWRINGDRVFIHRNRSSWGGVTSPQLPVRGMGNSVLIGHHLYGRINYAASQPDYRGLARLDVFSGAVEIYTPTYADLQRYNFTDVTHAPERNCLYMNHRGYGIAEFHLGTHRWRLLNDWQLEGVHPIVAHFFAQRWTNGLYYDDVTKCVYSGHGNSLWSTGPWSRGHPDLHWFPQTPGFWDAYVARHSVLPLPPDVTHVDQLPDPKIVDVPMIWTMPSND